MRTAIDAFLCSTLFVAVVLPHSVRCEEIVTSIAPPNTSASLQFRGTSNGNLSGNTSVSKVNIHTLLYPAHTTKVLAHYLPWWGASSHINIGYSSTDPEQIARTFDDIDSRGIDGIVVDWYGKGHFTDEAWQRSVPIIKRFPRLSFSIMIDAGTFKWNRCMNCDLTQTILYHLDYASAKYLSSRQYLRYKGKPVVFEFGMEGMGIVDWDHIQAAHPEILWVHTHRNGFNIENSAGAFLWIDPPPNPIRLAAADTSQLENFYRYARSKPAKIAVGGVSKGFDDSLAEWAKTKPRYLPQSCGATWLKSFEVLNKYFNTDRQLPFLQLITWNDYEEGTALETGIEGCVIVNARLNKHTLDVLLTHVETVDHLELYEQVRPNAYRLIQRFPASTITIPLPQSDYGTFFVEAVGKPFFRNVVSAPILVPPGY